MHMTTVLRKARSSSIKSLALSVHFKQPEFGMKDYEILSRASTFLLAVDPKEAPSESKYAWLEENIKEREKLAHKQNYAYEPAGGPRREAKDLGWLEFCPKNFRPVVHCVASSHVIAPWRWRNYYSTQEWLSKVKPEHWYVCCVVLCPQTHTHTECTMMMMCNLVCVWNDKDSHILGVVLCCAV